MNTAIASPARTPAAAPAAQAPRYDIYAAIHRALRLCMNDTLGRLGWLDPGDRLEVDATVDQLGRLLAFCRSHLEHENAFVHTAIEARRPGATQRIGAEHEQHRDEIDALEAEGALLRAAPGGPQALRLYRRLALFVAHNFEHMHYEEKVHNELLWAAYGDAEIMAIEERLVASLGPDERAAVLRWMTPALPPAERALWFGGMRAQMPPPAFTAVLDAAREVLDDTAWAKLTRALGLPPVPGLVSV